MATITRKEVEELFAEIVEVKVKSEVEKRLKEEMAKVNKEVNGCVKEGSLEAKVKSEVDRQLKGSVQGLQASLDEGQKLHQRMMLVLQRYAEEVPMAERMCEALSKQLATPGQPESAAPAAAHANGIASAGPTWYRNIKYADSAAAFNAVRLNVHEAPSTSAFRRASLEFGALLPVERTQPVGQSLWLQLAQGATTSSGQDLQGFWVQATLDDGTIECAEVKGDGRPDPTEYTGQTFGRFYTEGFNGPHDAVVLSASGQGFWPMLNLTCMLRGIAMATVFEKDWADSTEGFATWVPFYALNVYRFGLAGRRKKMYVTVKPTANWRRYAGPRGTSVQDPENVKGDIGRAQFCECNWLLRLCRKLGFEWGDITFITALSFLRAQGKWTEEQCIEESLQELERAHSSFNTLDEEEMEREFFAQLFCTEEALGFVDLQAELGVESGDRKAAHDPENPESWPGTPAPKPEQAARARDLLRAMLQTWMGTKESFIKSLQDLKLEPDDLRDIGILTNPDRGVLHAAARGGQPRVLCTVLDELRKANVMRDWLLRPDLQERQTPLHAAVAARQKDAAAILLKVTDSKQLGRLVEMVDKNGRSLMDLVVSANDTALDEMLMGQMLEALHAQGSLHSTVFRSCVSPQLYSRLLRVQFKNSTIPTVLLQNLQKKLEEAHQKELKKGALQELKEAADTKREVVEVITRTVRNASVDTLSVLLDGLVNLEKGLIKLFLEELQAVGRWQEVVQTSSKSQLCNWVETLLLGNHKNMAGFIAALRAAHCLEEVVKADEELILWRIVRSLKIARDKENLGHLMESVVQAGSTGQLCSLVKGLAYWEDGENLAGIMVALRKAGRFEEVVTASGGWVLCQFLCCLNYAGDDENLGHFVETVVQAGSKSQLCELVNELRLGLFPCRIKILAAFMVALRKVGRFKEVVTASGGWVLRRFLCCLDYAVDDENLGHFVETVAWAGTTNQLCALVKELSSWNRLQEPPVYQARVRKILAGIILALRKVGRFEEVVQASTRSTLALCVERLHGAGDKENLNHLIMAVRTAGRWEEVEKRLGPRLHRGLQGMFNLELSM